MNKTPNEIIDALISIKDWHKGDLMLCEIETINDACNCIKRLAEELKSRSAVEPESRSAGVPEFSLKL